MLTTKINKDDYDKLKKYFDEYCMIIYNRLYPVTDNNIKLYFQDIINYHYKGEIPKHTEQIMYNNININVCEVYGFSFIVDNHLRLLSSMIGFSSELNNIKNDSIK